MKKFRYPLLLIAFIFLFISKGCGVDNNIKQNVVVKYDSKHSVTVEELHKYIGDGLYYKKFPDRADMYNNAVNDMVTNQLKRIDFFEKGLNKNDTLIKNISRVINEELISEYFETQYLARYANEDSAKKIYQIMDKEVIYQLIELRKPENASQEQIDSLKEKALEIKSEIDAGKEFASLAQIYSQNQISLKNNGFMPPVNWRQSLMDPVGNVIFKLNKNDVHVLNSDYAFLIVKVIDINKIHVAPFDSIKNKIISDLKGIYVNRSVEEYERDKKALIDESSLKWNQTALNQIVNWSHIPEFFEKEYPKIINTVLENGDNKVILTYNNNSKLDYKDLLRLLDNILIMKTSKEIKEEDIKNFLLEAIRTDILVKKADSLNLKGNIFNAFSDNIVLKNYVLLLYNQVEIDGKIPETTEEALYKFFKENEDGLYYQLEKRNLFVMVFPDKAEAENTMAKINSGTPFEKVTGRYLVKTYIKERDGEIKSFLSNEKPVFGSVGFKLKESEVSGPVEFKDENNETKYAVIKCYHIRPEKQLTFEDVRNTIIEDFRKHHREIISKEVEEKLKAKYQPEINKDVLAKLISLK